MSFKFLSFELSSKEERENKIYFLKREFHVIVGEEGSVRWALGQESGVGGTQGCGRWGEARAGCPAKRLDGRGTKVCLCFGQSFGVRASSPLASGQQEKRLHCPSSREPGAMEGDPEDSDISDNEIHHQVQAGDGECGFFQRATACDPLEASPS